MHNIEFRGLQKIVAMGKKPEDHRGGVGIFYPQKNLAFPRGDFQGASHSLDFLLTVQNSLPCLVMQSPLSVAFDKEPCLVNQFRSQVKHAFFLCARNLKQTPKVRTEISYKTVRALRNEFSGGA